MHRLQGPGSSSGGQRIAVLPEPDRSCAPKGRGRAQARSRAASRSRTPIRRRAPSRSRSRASSNLRRPRRRGRSRTRSRAPAADDGQPRSKALARGPSQQTRRLSWNASKRTQHSPPRPPAPPRQPRDAGSGRSADAGRRRSLGSPSSSSSSPRDAGRVPRDGGRASPPPAPKAMPTLVRPKNVPPPPPPAVTWGPTRWCDGGGW